MSCVVARWMPLVFVLTLASSLHAAPTPAEDGTAPIEEVAPQLIPNLRSQRQPVRPWVVKKGAFSATVKARTLSSSFTHVTWQLDVQLTGPRTSWTLLSATTATADTNVERVEPAAAGDRGHRLVLRVTAPRMCSIEQPREPVSIDLRYQMAGRVRAASLRVDERCLIGDVVKFENAARFERLALVHLHDPVIDALVAHANKSSVRLLSHDIRVLKEQLGFGEHSVQPDPPNLARAGAPYALSPSETARLGGDCEDWSILTAAYLKRLGWNAQLQDNQVHVWVTVTGPGESDPAVVDLVKEVEQASASDG